MPIHSCEQSFCVPQNRVRKYTTFYITADYKIIDFYNPDYIYGFKNMELDNKMEKIKPYDVCGLLEGTTGVCLSLLEGEKKSDNLWKKAFLLA
jgi:hypothetical protein